LAAVPKICSEELFRLGVDEELEQTAALAKHTY
jgi:hypothetical protein